MWLHFIIWAKPDQNGFNDYEWQIYSILNRDLIILTHLLNVKALVEYVELLKAECWWFN